MIEIWRIILTSLGNSFYHRRMTHTFRPAHSLNRVQCLTSNKPLQRFIWLTWLSASILLWKVNIPMVRRIYKYYYMEVMIATVVNTWDQLLLQYSWGSQKQIHQHQPTQYKLSSCLLTWIPTKLDCCIYQGGHFNCLHRSKYIHSKSLFQLPPISQLWTLSLCNS